jgi:hypothetical protein
VDARVGGSGLKDGVFGSSAQPRFRFGFLLALVALGSASCAGGRFEAGVYSDSQTAYRIGSLDAAWARFSLSGSNLAFRHPSGGSILVNSTCEGIKDVPSEVLVNQSLFGVEQKHELEREVFTLDGRAATRVRLTGALDGVAVHLDLVVLKKDDCVYDLELVAGGSAFPDSDQDFWRFVQGFQQLPVRP